MLVEEGEGVLVIGMMVVAGEIVKGMLVELKGETSG